MQDWELWGTFSVGDHLRRRAFVADVLLYDRLVIPTPPEKDEEEEERWRKMGWVPGRQRRLLEVIHDALGKGHLIRVPWTFQQRSAWEGRYKAEMAAAVGPDVKAVQQRREQPDWQRAETRRQNDLPAAQNRRGQTEEVDWIAHHVTRQLLMDWSDMQNDTDLFRSIPSVQVKAVAAYGSYRSLSRDHCIAPDEGKGPQANLLNLFGWEFLVPNKSEYSDEDLLKQALEIASLDQTKRHREAFHLWRRDMALEGQSPKQSLNDMEDLIKEYRAAVDEQSRRSNFKTGSKWAFAIEAAGATAAAFFLPALGVPGAFASIGALIAEHLPEPENVPAKLKVAAMFYDARKHFGWYCRQR